MLSAAKRGHKSCRRNGFQGLRAKRSKRVPSATLLTLRDIRKRFGATTAVDGLSLEVRAGEVFGLLGPNGAGKSTTIAITTGLLAPDAGAVDLLGLGSPAEPRVRMHLGLAPQEITLYGELTARENLMFFARLYGIAAPRARVDELLAMVRRIADHGTTVLMVEQNVKKALAVADRGYVLERGALIASGPARLLQRSNVIREAYLGADATDHTTAADAVQRRRQTTPV